jgi:hypothetical protein
MFDQPVENASALTAMRASSAFILGRTMFGPVARHSTS